MLFNSLPFLLGFLPFSVALDYLAYHYFPHRRLQVLLALSLLFYSYWDWRFLPLLIISIAINWIISRLVTKSLSYRDVNTSRSVCKYLPGTLVFCAISINLLVLAAFKYSDLSRSAVVFMGFRLNSSDVILPLGVSFFTFHHIMYLVDLKSKRAPPFDFTHYALYICFFPQVLAGPLVRWSEVMHQFDRMKISAPSNVQIASGLALLTLGLFKKTCLGDELTAYVDPAFASTNLLGTITMVEAWLAALSFSFKIYFDFSGYTDMALGTALLFGIALPENFDTPYAATSLQSFWRRWHMTLSRFLRDYLYVPLGGNRSGLSVQMGALTATMVLGGLWHGYGWTFVAWGALHGVGLALGLLWRKSGVALPAIITCLLTFIFVTLAWVLFRAESLSSALIMYKGLFAQTGIGATKVPSILLVAAVCAFIPLTTPSGIERLQRASLGWVGGLAFAALLLKLGGSGSYQFIYFQF